MSNSTLDRAAIILAIAGLLGAYFAKDDFDTTICITFTAISWLFIINPRDRWYK